MKLCKLGIHKKIGGGRIDSDSGNQAIYYNVCKRCQKILNAFVVTCKEV